MKKWSVGEEMELKYSRIQKTPTVWQAMKAKNPLDPDMWRSAFLHKEMLWSEEVYI